jgi:FkbM family methyltransferase
VLNDKNLFETLISNSENHCRDSNFYINSEKKLKLELKEIKDEFYLGEIGKIHFPYFAMGNINSLDLFGLDELILFSFYFSNRSNFKNVLDLGANIGLHSLVMKKLGFTVTSYEPDPIHTSQFKKVMNLNGFDDLGLRERAISDKFGNLDFIRILGNTTGSFLAGSKENSYGPINRFSVEVDDIYTVLKDGDFDFIKMDVEGHEATLLERIPNNLLEGLKIMLEIGSEKNAKEIFRILIDRKIPAYSQKSNWKRVQSLFDLPAHHSQGSLLISLSGPPTWR